ncbi:MAG: restriction endonuclease [Lachnospiraceae bacterium]|nr:restriction endonuclease [Lachnospiraceae bacterium]
MIFTALPDEQRNINMIREVRGGDYVIVRMTPTMIAKNNLDANALLRDLLEKAGIVNYEELENGHEHKVSSIAVFIQKNKTTSVKMNFYRVTNSRGDRRFSIETIKRKMHDKEVCEGDLLYFATYRDIDGNSRIFMINLTSNTPSKEQIISAVGMDKISQKFEEIKPRLVEILDGSWFDNSKGEGPKDPKDVGDTLESLLLVETNNRHDADLDGLIEIKAKASKTLDTLFTLRPRFEGTTIATVEPSDKSRVSAFTRFYGYESESHPNSNSLYITIGSKEAPQNTQGFYLEVDEENSVVNLMRQSSSNKSEVTAFWTFEDLKKQLEDKHPSTLWVRANERTVGNMVQFQYTEIEFSRAPQFMTFLALIKTGVITYDWRGYTTKTGKYTGKNHGNAWRIRPKSKSDLFGEISIVDLTK